MHSTSTLKRFFLLPFLVYVLCAFVFASFQLVFSSTHIFHSAWLPVCIAQTCAFGAFVHAIKKKTPPHNDWPAYIALFVACCMLGWFVLESTTAPRAAMLPAVALLATTTLGLILYVFWYTPANRAHSRIAVGSPIPEARFATANGQMISTKNQGKAVWVFIRGNWCPFCMAQVEELAQHYAQLQALGAAVFVVSAQKERQSAQLAQQHKATIQFLTDPGLQGAKALGIEHINGVDWGVKGYAADTMHPTTIVTNSQGIVVFADQTKNYRVRASVASFITALQQAS